MGDLPDTLTPASGATTESENNKAIRIPWGRLLATKLYINNIDLIDDYFSFGRAFDCTVFVTSQQCRKATKLISKTHFSIEKSFEDNLIYIRDLSKNGTFVNKILLGKGKRRILRNNDTIAVTVPTYAVYIFKYNGYEGNDTFLPSNLEEKYAHIRLLGRGACGEVRLVKNRDTFEFHAVKKILLGRSNTSLLHQINHPTKIQNEISILRKLSHPCVICMDEIFQNVNDIYIVLEYMAGGELNNRIIAVHNELDEDLSKFYFFQMILAVQYLHSNGIVHRDLKPENILLLDERPETILKITDFGLSKVTNCDNMTTMCGTLKYVAPEVLHNGFRDYGEYGKGVDIWSLGVILFYMLSKEHPFRSNDAALLRTEIVNGNYHMVAEKWSDVSAEVQDLVKKMLVLLPKKRISNKDILAHPWIKNDHGVQHRAIRLLKNEGYENPLNFLATEPPEKKFKFNEYSSSSSSGNSNSTLRCATNSFNSTVCC
ncbi:serine/threonine-protein kinase Chk2 [Sitophilus oryzae]|uniref:Serine/threonine-protein kinase Chk2 n=1 Tax=Sitophilus oryzae TaxID=7048 RepID=A0A6J2Y6X3_SITOR|nr:serine/threonine-protein kinase Chk2 [Sitophilus oryzae]